MSPQPRPDIEQLLAAYPLDRDRPGSQVRSRSGEPIFERISHASIFTRGLTEVGPGQPATAMNASGESFDVTPTRLFANTSGDEISFTRWFQSE